MFFDKFLNLINFLCLSLFGKFLDNDFAIFSFIKSFSLKFNDSIHFNCLMLDVIKMHDRKFHFLIFLNGQNEVDGKEVLWGKAAEKTLRNESGRQTELRKNDEESKPEEAAVQGYVRHKGATGDQKVIEDYRPSHSQTCFPKSR